MSPQELQLQRPREIFSFDRRDGPPWNPIHPNHRTSGPNGIIHPCGLESYLVIRWDWGWFRGSGLTFGAAWSPIDNNMVQEIEVILQRVPSAWTTIVPCSSFWKILSAVIGWMGPIEPTPGSERDSGFGRHGSGSGVPGAAKQCWVFWNRLIHQYYLINNDLIFVGCGLLDLEL